MAGQPWIKVGSIFTHLSGTDDEKWDDFSHEQVRRFDLIYSQLVVGLGYAPERHLMSSMGILRFPQYNMKPYGWHRIGMGWEFRSIRS